MTNQQWLDAIEGAISGTLDRNAQEYAINGRHISSFNLIELFKLRNQFALAVSREQQGMFFASDFRNPE